MEDMHIHIRDGINNLEELKKFIERGISKKIKKFLLVEHGNRISEKHIGYLTSNKQIDDFKDSITKIQNIYKDIKILKGIEIDYSIEPSFRKDTLNILKYGDFDLVIGSIHSYQFTDGLDYFKYIIDMINNYPIDIIGHIILRDNWEEYKDILKKIIILCSKKNIKIEINTSDRSRWNNEQLSFMLNEMNKYGVMYSFGSDAHSSEEVGYRIEETYERVLLYNKKN